MDANEIWKRFQKHMGYTDEEMKVFRSDPVKVKMVTGTPEFIKCRVIAEVIESHGCHAGHKVGDRFVLTPGGQILTGESPKNICLSALVPVGHVLPAVTERLINRSDPGFERFQVVQCADVGLDKGGWGKILLKVYVENPSAPRKR